MQAVLVVDGAGGSNGAPVLGDDGDVRGAVVVGHVEHWLVVIHGMRCAVGDLLVEFTGVGRGSYVLDELGHREWNMGMNVMPVNSTPACLPPQNLKGRAQRDG